MFHTCIKLFLPTPVYVCIFYISGQVISDNDTQSAQISQKQDRSNIYAIMKTMCPPGYYNNNFVATHALRYMVNNAATVHHVPKYMSCPRAIVVTGRAHCLHIKLIPTPAFFRYKMQLPILVLHICQLF